MKSIMNLDDVQYASFISHTIEHCGNCIASNAFGSDDSRDYIESSIDILNLVLGPNPDDEMIVKLTLDSMFNAPRDDDEHPYNQYASDAVPTFWDEYIVNKD
jgi:hypothetical protein